MDAEGRPLPWYTYPAIEYLAQLDFSNRTVFEFGCGNSTLFWSQRAGRVVSVEHDAAWAAKMRPLLPGHCTLILETRREPYLDVLRRSDQRYDVIVIDGAARVSCSEFAPAHLTDGGMVILDNSDWFPQASANLRGAGLIEADMTGFAPIIDHASTTSFYFARGFNIPSGGDRQPHPGIGSRPKPVFTPLT